MTGTIACPLCGTLVEPGRDACRSCPVGPNCTVLCCPGCGYRFVERSAIL
jgi:hypothetical protein